MSEQLSLPYIAIEKLAVRDTIRKRKEITHGGRESWNIPFELIEERENFNTRYDYEGTKELAESILANGQLEPIYVDVLANGKIYVERGHRRLRAIKFIRDNNMSFASVDGAPPRNAKSFDTVECFINKSSMTEEQRVLNLFSTNMHYKELLPLEQAESVRRLKFCLGKEKSNETIAAQLGVSRQTIDNLIVLASAPDDVKEQVRVGNMNLTNAVAFVRAQKKQSKAAGKAEEESHKTTQSPTSLPEDSLATEMKELKELEENTERFKEKQAEKAARELERLLDYANEVLVNKDSLTPHIGKRLAAPAYGIWIEKVLDENSGEVVDMERQELLLGKDQEITEVVIDELIRQGAKTVYIYKVHTAAPSVFTELPSTEEKSKFDLDREEMAQITNCIKLADKLEAIVNKLDVNDGTKTDVSNIVKWLQKDLDAVRTWVHNNRKFNKLR